MEAGSSFLSPDIIIIDFYSSVLEFLENLFFLARAQLRHFPSVGYDKPNGGTATKICRFHKRGLLPLQS